MSASLWKVDPTFTNYIPQTAEEAVGRFVRCRNNGMSAMMIPECLIACSRGLTPDELDVFEQWIINPSGPVSLNGPLVATKALTETNTQIYNAAVKSWEQKTSDGKEEQDDEKMEELPWVPPVLTATERKLMRSRAAEPPSSPGAPADTHTTSGADPCPPAGASG